MPRTRHVLAAATAAVLLAACGGGTDTVGQTDPEPTPTATSSGTPAPSPTATASPSPSEDPQSRTTVSVYFLKDEKVQPVARTVTGPAVATGAVRALLEGPTAAEKAAGLFSAVPEGTQLRGLTIAGGLATVDLNRQYESGGGSVSMATRLAQVVFTLTRFPTVDRVEFRLDGEAVTSFGGEGIVLDRPATRARFEDHAPAVLVESPTLGASVSSPLGVTGSANMFEAVFHLELTDASGAVLASRRVEATSGTGTRGTFDTTLEFESPGDGTGRLVAFVYSAQDGSRQDIVSIPVRFADKGK